MRSRIDYVVFFSSILDVTLRATVRMRKLLLSQSSEIPASISAPLTSAISFGLNAFEATAEKAPVRASSENLLSNSCCDISSKYLSIIFFIIFPPFYDLKSNGFWLTTPKTETNDSLTFYCSIDCAKSQYFYHKISRSTSYLLANYD